MVRWRLMGEAALEKVTRATISEEDSFRLGLEG